MCRIKGIETVLGHIPVDETPCAVIQEDDRTGKQRTDYAVVHHQRKANSSCIILRKVTGVFLPIFNR